MVDRTLVACLALIPTLEGASMAADPTDPWSITSGGLAAEPAQLAATDDRIRGMRDVRMLVRASVLLANDHGPDAKTLQIVGVVDATHGTAKLTEDGDVVFEPAPGFLGVAGFVYEVTDGKETRRARVLIDIHAPPPPDPNASQ